MTAPSSDNTSPFDGRGVARFAIEGAVAVVTGGAGGIGRALTVELAAAGADIVVVEHPDVAVDDALATEVGSLGRTLTWESVDLADTHALAGAVDRIWDASGGIDILVNNAGVSTLAWFPDQDIEIWRRTMAVNLDAPFELSRACARRMIESGREGRIIMISSKNGHAAEQGLLAYNASKAGLEMLARSLAVEVGRFGITVNSVAPGMIRTTMAEDFDLNWPAFTAYYHEHIPSRVGFADAVDVAGAVLLLASPAGRYITGATIVVDGGVLAQQLPRDRFMPPFPLT